MDAFDVYQNGLMNINRLKFIKFGELRWLNPYLAEEQEELRNNLAAACGSSMKWSFNETKPWINRISKGCELCGKGEWSCLFITGICNGNCFYCPTSQDTDHLPTTQQITFTNPADYASYINHFGFKGVSFSGGEPFLAFDKVVDFLTELRKSCPPDLYIWMYTNGLLATREKFEILAALGMNEVRFDIGATKYSLNYVKEAKGIIPNITIEIPAIPEELELLKSLLPEMIDAGVTNLNLHQMRLTSHNAGKLMPHKYTYLSLEHSVVWESELTAFELMKYASQNKLDIGINYCAFQFKNRHQKAGFRNRVAHALICDLATITANGYVRNMFVIPPSLWVDWNNKLLELSFQKACEIMKRVTLVELVSGIYHESKILFWYQGIDIKDADIRNDLAISNKEYQIEIALASELIVIEPEEQTELVELFTSVGAKVPLSESLFSIWQKEFIEKGFRPL